MAETRAQPTDYSLERLTVEQPGLAEDSPGRRFLFNSEKSNHEVYLDRRGAVGRYSCHRTEEKDHRPTGGFSIEADDTGKKKSDR